MKIIFRKVNIEGKNFLAVPIILLQIKVKNDIKSSLKINKKFLFEKNISQIYIYFSSLLFCIACLAQSLKGKKKSFGTAMLIL
jgi:hypothetical protein